MTHPALDVERWDDTVPAEIMIADGYNVTVTVRKPHLVVSDGTPGDKRVRQLARVGHDVRTLMVLGKHGYVTLEAKRWLHETRIRYVELDGDRCEVSGGWCDAKAVAGQVTKPVPVARFLIGEKLQGQARIADWLGEPRAVKTISKWYASLEDADATMRSIKTAEAIAAKSYWTAWRNRLVIPWHPRDLAEIPAHWGSFQGRATLRRNAFTNYGATDPVNAMLNYAYTVAGNACTIACRAYGLEPSLGVMHDPRDDYDAFAWDLVEAIRPVCDERVYDYLSSVKWFDRRWCHETGSGVVVLDPPLTHTIAGWSRDLLALALPVAKTVRGLLWNCPR